MAARGRNRETERDGTLTASPPRHRHDAGIWRTWVDTDDGPLWFESGDAALEPSAEAFLCALLVPALERRARLAFPVPLDPEFHAGLDRLLPIFRDWWGYRDDVPGSFAVDDPPAASRSPAVASCFTGGADSFYNLLTGGQRSDVLLFVLGYDMRLADGERFGHFHRSLTQVAAATGAKPLVVRTNLREHPIAAGVPWERWHGGALAAAGHVCAGTIGTLRIPPSYRMDRLRPWGSDPRVDPLMSSSRLTILHPPASSGRVERIAAIGAHPLVRDHLRVCFENRAPHGNCSRCEKCVSTMTTLEGLGLLDGYTVFDRSIPVEDLIDALPHIAHHGLGVWRDIAALDHRPPVRAALKRLLGRTPGRLKRAWWKVLTRWRRMGAGTREQHGRR